jgi:hypothetical protein
VRLRSATVLCKDYCIVYVHNTVAIQINSRVPITAARTGTARIVQHEEIHVLIPVTFNKRRIRMPTGSPSRDIGGLTMGGIQVGGSNTRAREMCRTVCEEKAIASSSRTGVKISEVW